MCGGLGEGVQEAEPEYIPPDSGVLVPIGEHYFLGVWTGNHTW